MKASRNPIHVSYETHSNKSFLFSVCHLELASKRISKTPYYSPDPYTLLWHLIRVSTRVRPCLLPGTWNGRRRVTELGVGCTMGIALSINHLWQEDIKFVHKIFLTTQLRGFQTRSRFGNKHGQALWYLLTQDLSIKTALESDKRRSMKWRFWRLQCREFVVFKEPIPNISTCY